MVKKSKVDYKNGKIYVIRNHINDKVYVGSTTQSLSKRFSKHKEYTTTKGFERARRLHKTMVELGIDNFYIELIENYPCESKEELHSREGHFIREFDSFKNGYNYYVAGRKKKEYYNENKGELLLEQKEYKKNNKEKVFEIQKSYREQNKDKLREDKKKYYKENKEAILCKENLKYEDVKNDKTTCECGSTVLSCRFLRHKKSKKHIEFVENNKSSSEFKSV